MTEPDSESEIGKMLEPFEIWGLYWLFLEKDTVTKHPDTEDTFQILSSRGKYRFILFGKIREKRRRKVPNEKEAQIGFILMNPEAEFLDDRIVVDFNNIGLSRIFGPYYSQAIYGMTRDLNTGFFPDETLISNLIEMISVILCGMPEEKWKYLVETWERLATEGKSVSTVLGGAPGLMQQRR